jgi:hypothetical protein
VIDLDEEQWTREELADLSGVVIVDVADQVSAPAFSPIPLKTVCMRRYRRVEPPPSPR